MTELGRRAARLPFGWRLVIACLTGVLGGFALAAVAVISYLIGDREEFVTKHGTLGSLMILYVGGGVAGGLIGGLLSPFAKSSLGTVIVGALAGLPLLLGAVRQVFGPVSTWETRELVLALAMAAILGGGTALQLRKLLRGGSESAPKQSAGGE